MSESLIKKHLLKPMPINLIKRNNKTTQLRRKLHQLRLANQQQHLLKKNHKTRQPKDDNNNRQVLKKKLMHLVSKDKTPATKPAKGEVESSSTTPTKVVSATQNVAKPTSASSETTKGVVQTSAGSSEAKIMLHYKKQTLKHK